MTAPRCLFVDCSSPATHEVRQLWNEETVHMCDEHRPQGGGAHMWYETRPLETCDECEGSGEVEVAIGGDGYGGRCSGTMDVPTVCSECKGSGRVAR